MVLHIFAKGLNQESLLKKCLLLKGAEDAVIFIEDGVHWASDSPLASQYLNTDKLYYLVEDGEARGLKHLCPNVTAVDYAGFTDLTVEHERSVSWF